MIVEKTFNLAVTEKQIENNDDNNNGNNNDNIEDNVLDNKEEEINTNNNGEDLPSTLPKTGETKYAFIFIIIGTLSVAYVVVSKKNVKH